MQSFGQEISVNEFGTVRNGRNRPSANASIAKELCLNLG